MLGSRATTLCPLDSRRLVSNRCGWQRLSESSGYAPVEKLLNAGTNSYADAEIERYLNEEVPRDEYEKLFQAYKDEIAKEGSFFEQFRNKPSSAFESTVRSLVRATIRPRVAIMPFEEFCRREASRILTPLNTDPRELMITSKASPEARSGSETNDTRENDQNTRFEPTPL